METSPATIVPDQKPPRLQWKVLHPATDHVHAQMALYRNGLLAATYRDCERFVMVTEHHNGENRTIRCLTVASVRKARNVCRQLALGSFPASPAPAPDAPEAG